MPTIMIKHVHTIFNHFRHKVLQEYKISWLGLLDVSDSSFMDNKTYKNQGYTFLNEIEIWEARIFHQDRKTQFLVPQLSFLRWWFECKAPQSTE